MTDQEVEIRKAHLKNRQHQCPDCGVYWVGSHLCGKVELVESNGRRGLLVFVVILIAFAIGGLIGGLLGILN